MISQCCFWRGFFKYFEGELLSTHVPYCHGLMWSIFYKSFFIGGHYKLFSLSSCYDMQQIKKVNALG